MRLKKVLVIAMVWLAAGALPWAMAEEQQQAAPAEKEAEPPKARPWQVVVTPGVGVSYRTSGHLAVGHQFGFLKYFGKCEEDNLWLAISSRDKALEKQTVNQVVKTELLVDSKIKLKNLPIYYMGFQKAVNDTTDKDTPDVYLAAFTNYVVGPDLAKFFNEGSSVDVSFTEPAAFAALMAVRTETFGLIGLTAAKNKALKACQENQSKPVKAAN